MRVLTYNVYCDGKEYIPRLNKILKLVVNENPDFIALQEVKYGSYDLIRSVLSKWYCFVDKKVEFNRMYGEMLFTKSKPELTKYIRFKNSPNIRGLTVYEFGGMVLGTTHLEVSNISNISNCSEITEYLDNKNCFVLMGDFNFFENNRGFDYSEIGSENTFVSEKYNSRPDRIYYKNFVPVESKVIKNDFSDHYGLVGTFY